MKIILKWKVVKEYHLHYPNVCKGCYNYQRLDAGDWEWCPEHKDTFRQFECTKSILPSTVINSINQQLGNFLIFITK